MAFSDNLQFIRAQAGVTQEQLAEQLDVSRQSVSKWESGASFPEMDTLLRICDLYDVNMDTLLRGSVEDSHGSLQRGGLNTQKTGGWAHSHPPVSLPSGHRSTPSIICWLNT